MASPTICDVLRLIDVYRSKGLYVGSVVLTRYEDQTSVQAFRQQTGKLRALRSTAITALRAIRKISR